MTEHIDSASEKWSQLSLEEQLANIGSEVSRTIKGRGNDSRYWGAICRALDLFYLTVEDPRWRKRLKEILRVRELFCAAVLGSDEYNTTLEDLDNYFYYFASAARAQKEMNLARLQKRT